MRCSTEGCDADATLQWQRPASDDEAAAHLDGVRAGIARVNDERRLSLRVQVAQLREARDNPPKGLSEPDQRAFLARVDAQIAAAQAEHDAITDVVDLDHHLPVTVAVFGCEQHSEETP